MKMLYPVLAVVLLTLSGCVTVHRDEPVTTTRSTTTTVAPAASTTVSRTTTY